MAPSTERSKHVITWSELEAFASEAGRDRTHVLRVFKGERQSKALEERFAERFGFAMRDAALAGRATAAV